VRYFVVDGATGGVGRYAQTFQAYARAQSRTPPAGHGFEDAGFFSSPGGREGEDAEGDLMAVVARRP